MDTLTAEQLRAFNALLTDKNIFVTGSGGTGKSFLIQTVYNELPRLKLRDIGLGIRISVTALTGCAAILLGCHAKTLHSWAGIGLGKGTVQEHVRDILKSPRLKKNWICTDLLMIDEISMLTPELLEKLDDIGRIIRKNKLKSFGGIQLMLIGDFLQLPPITKGKMIKFAFESDRWLQIVDECLELTQIQRQTDDKFRTILNEARNGKLTSLSIDSLSKRMHLDWKSNKIRPTLLFPRRAEVDLINESNLKALTGKRYSYKVSTVLGPEVPIFNTKDEFFQRYIELVDKDASYLTELILCEGAQVMLLTNLDITNKLINGSRGVIIGFTETTKYPIVEFLSGLKITISPHCWELNDYPHVFRSQIPLRLAYAVTIHKCVSEDTLLSLPGKGLIKIKDLECKNQKANTVYCPDSLQVSGMCETKDIMEVYKGEIEDGIKFTSTFGYEITTSTRHPLLTFNKELFTFEWKQSPTITKDDYIVLKKGAHVEGTYFSLNSVTFTKPYNKIINVPDYLNEEFGYFLGVMLGDGSINPKTYRFDLVGIDMDILDRCADILDSQFNIKIVQHQCKERTTIINRIFFHSKQLIELFRFIGYNFQKADKKEIPDCILGSPISVQKAVIQGLYDTDGGVSKTVINYTTTSEVMGKQIQQMLFNMNIAVSRTMMRDNVIEKNWKAVYRLNMSGKSALQFVTDVGFKCKRKIDESKERFYEKSTLRKNSKSQSFEIPNGSQLITNLRNEMRFGLKRIKSDRITLSGNKILSSIITKSQKLRCDSVNVIINEINNISQYPTGKLLSFINNNSILIDTIKNIEDITNIQMYDIGVSPLNTSGFLPDGHDFIGNGFVNHNCQGSTIDCALIDIGSNIFEFGQAYVALSRVRTLDSLYIHAFDEDVFYAHPRVLEFYKQLHEKSVLKLENVTDISEDPITENPITENPWLFESVPEAWKSILIKRIATLTKLSAILDDKNYLPIKNNIWNALSYVKPEEVRVIILGQDPYPTEGHAMGLAFSIEKDIRPLPGSLRNIFKELESDLGIIRTDGCLEDWAKQGILLLNTVLTVEIGNPQSHSKIGWEDVTNEIIGALTKRNIIFVLWGRSAQVKKKLLTGESILEAAHPSPLSAHTGFYGSTPFSKINIMLEEKGNIPICWG